MGELTTLNFQEDISWLRGALTGGRKVGQSDRRQEGGSV